MATVLVTGGAGYIGTHILAVLAKRGYHCVCLDNYSNSSPRAIDRVCEISGRAIDAYEVDIRDAIGLRRIFSRHEVDSVIHLAGLKAVGESVQFPKRYHDNNVGGTRTLLEVVGQTRVRKLVFSSSAAVYGTAGRMPIAEDTPAAPMSPYGENKLEIERMLVQLAGRDPSWRIASLRYFNPVGAHSSGKIGEDPAGEPSNLMPFVCQVAAGTLPELRIFGGDYPTPDGTGVRDYIHVMDLAEGHVAALEAIESWPAGTVSMVNLGTGKGVSVLQLVETFERVNGLAIPRRVVGRRAGDTAECYADVSLAKDLLGWEAKRGLAEMCRDAWRWQSRNPEGYR